MNPKDQYGRPIRSNYTVPTYYQPVDEPQPKCSRFDLRWHGELILRASEAECWAKVRSLVDAIGPGNIKHFGYTIKNTLAE
jgi:hypothetical protein